MPCSASRSWRIGERIQGRCSATPFPVRDVSIQESMGSNREGAVCMPGAPSPTTLGLTAQALGSVFYRSETRAQISRESAKVETRPAPSEKGGPAKPRRDGENFRRCRKFHFNTNHLDWVVRGAVRSEPVSGVVSLFQPDFPVLIWFEGAFWPVRTSIYACFRTYYQPLRPETAAEGRRINRELPLE